MSRKLWITFLPGTNMVTDILHEEPKKLNGYECIETDNAIVNQVVMQSFKNGVKVGVVFGCFITGAVWILTWFMV